MTRDVVPMLGDLLAIPTRLLEQPLLTRPLQAQDIGGLGQLMLLAFQGTVDDAGETAEEHLVEAEKTVVGGYGALIDDANFIAEHDRTMVGAVIVTEWQRRPLLAFVLVLPDYRDRGLGTALISRSAAELRALGYTEWTLAVTSGNPAMALYERLGFRKDQTLRQR